MAGFAHFARPLGFREHQLVDDDVVRVDLALGQLLDEPLRLVQGEELGDAHADEGGLFLVGARKVGKKIRQKAFNTTKSCVEFEFDYLHNVYVHIYI